MPAIISAILAISCYSLFLYNNGMGEFMVALLLIGITLVNVALMTIIKILKVTVFIINQTNSKPQYLQESHNVCEASFVILIILLTVQ